MSERKGERNDKLVRDRKSMSIWELARKYNISPTNVRRILEQETKRKPVEK